MRHPRHCLIREGSREKLILNIIQPGDTVVIVTPVGSANPGVNEVINERTAAIPGLLKDAPGPFSMIWTPIGSPDSDPYVLFVVRGKPKD